MERGGPQDHERRVMGTHSPPPSLPQLCNTSFSQIIYKYGQGCAQKSLLYSMAKCCGEWEEFGGGGVIWDCCCCLHLCVKSCLPDTTIKDVSSRDVSSHERVNEHGKE